MSDPVIAITGVILAAGRGVRAYPATRYMPKALLSIAGKTLLARNLDILVNELSVNEIVLVVGHYGDQIVKAIGDFHAGVPVKYVWQKEQKGIGHALLCAEDAIETSNFIAILGDELYVDVCHADLLSELKKSPKADAVLLFKHEPEPSKISQNYTAVSDGHKVLKLIEKPESPQSDLMGVGTYLLNKKVFNYIRSTPESPLRGEIEITDVLSRMAQTEQVRMYITQGLYLNVNTIEDRNKANYIIKDKNFSSYKVSLVIPAYNEEATIKAVIEEYAAIPDIHEILVVDNNSSDSTALIASAAGARVVSESRQGYGNALRCGLHEAMGDIVVLTEADKSFAAADIPKLLAYLKDCDMSIGTRTTRQMIEQGANMGGLSRLVNVVFGKLIELLWWGQEPRFTDVGCTYRAVWKSSYEKAAPYLFEEGPAFSPEMMMGMLICKLRVIEIPVTYRQRLGGDSKHSDGLLQLSKTALQMLRVIIQKRIKY